MSFLDPNGEFVLPAIFGGGAGAIIGGSVAIGVIGWIYTEATQPGTTKGFCDAVANSFNKAVDNVKDVYNKVTGNDKADGNKETANTNPFEGPVDNPVTVVDPAGNAIPVGKGEQLGGSKDGTAIQVKDSKGDPTGTRLDKGHKPNEGSHKDPRSQNPHGHVPGVNNPDGTPWLPIRVPKWVSQPS